MHSTCEQTSFMCSLSGWSLILLNLVHFSRFLNRLHFAVRNAKPFDDIDELKHRIRNHSQVVDLCPDKAPSYFKSMLRPFATGSERLAYMAQKVKKNGNPLGLLQV